MTPTPSYFIFCHRESHIQLQQQEINTCPAGPSASHHHEIQDIDTPPHYLAPDGVSENAYIVKKGRLLKPSVNTGLLHWPTNHENHYDTVGGVIRTTVCCTKMTHSCFL